MTTRTMMRPAPPTRRLNPISTGADILAFSIGLTGSFMVKLVGELPVSEALILLILPVLLIMHGRRLLRPGLKIIFILLALWLFSQVLTDIYRGTSAFDWVRSDANICFFAIDLVCVAVLLGRNERRKVIFIAAYAIGSLLAARYQPSQEAVQYPWKFGYAGGIISLVILASCYFYSRRRYTIALILLAGIMGVNLLKNYRGPVLDLLIVIALVMPLIPERIGRLRLLPRKGTGLRVVVLATMALGAGMAAAGLVYWVTAAGLVGEEAQIKNQAEAQSGGGLLLGGRPEILVSSQAVWDSPILGHGSYARDFKYIEMLNDIEARWGQQLDLRDVEQQGQGLIPAHSHLMGAWVQAGILGAVFWAYVLWLSLKGIVRVSLLLPPLAPLYAMMLVSFVWGIWFSPFASTERTQAALVIIFTLDLLDTKVPGFQALERPSRSKWRRSPLRGPLAVSRSNVNVPPSGATRIPGPFDPRR
jgi:hypothetical protein